MPGFTPTTNSSARLSSDDAFVPSSATAARSVARRGTLFFQPQRAEILFEGFGSSWYPRGQSSAAGVDAKFCSRPI
jgi:hypothetical protein